MISDRLNRTQCRQLLATAEMFLRSCGAQALSCGDEPATRYTLRRNTETTIKIWFLYKFRSSFRDSKLYDIAGGSFNKQQNIEKSKINMEAKNSKLYTIGYSVDLFYAVCRFALKKSIQQILTYKCSSVPVHGTG